MKASLDNTEPCYEESRGKAVTREVLRWCLWGIPLLAVGIGVFLLVVQNAHLSQAGRRFLSSFVYAVVIGMPSAVLLNWVGFRYTEKFPRLIVVINTLVLLVTATIGCLAAGLVFLAIGYEPSLEYWLEFRTSLATCYVDYADRRPEHFRIRNHAAQAAVGHAGIADSTSRAGTR